MNSYIHTMNHDTRTVYDTRGLKPLNRIQTCCMGAAVNGRLHRDLPIEPGFPGIPALYSNYSLFASLLVMSKIETKFDIIIFIARKTETERECVKQSERVIL